MLAYLRYDPIVHIDLGPLSISPHGIGIAVGYLLGAQLMLPAAKKKGITEDQVINLLTWAAVGALVGARVAYVLNHFGEYDNPIDWFQVWEGGISLLGGITGAILFALPRMRHHRLSFWKVMDAAAPGLALGVIIGRIGDLVVADHLGKTTDFFLGYVCRGVDTASPCMAPIGQAVHQPALYDLFATMLLLPLLLWLRKKPRYDGFLILVWGAWYGTGRIMEDFFRIDETHGTGLTGSQWTALATVLVCLSILLFVRRTPGRRGAEPPEEAPREAQEPAS